MSSWKETLQMERDWNLDLPHVIFMWKRVHFNFGKRVTHIMSGISFCSSQIMHQPNSVWIDEYVFEFNSAPSLYSYMYLQQCIIKIYIPGIWSLHLVDHGTQKVSEEGLWCKAYLWSSSIFYKSVFIIYIWLLEETCS